MEIQPSETYKHYSIYYEGNAMKTDRLYAITLYLLNHGKTSANELARHFEVSQRTIQRDMDSLCLAGIPIIATSGSSGGYEISENYRLEQDYATADDYSNIRTALRGLASATADPGVRHTLEKIVHAQNPGDNGIILDFSVLQEAVPNTLALLQSAVKERRAVEFTYTNNNHETRTHTVEPIAVIYRWYAWYLLAYSKVKDDYRTYKLVRMRHLKVTDIPFTKKHETADTILHKIDQTDSRQYTEIRLKCKEPAKARVIEYLKGTVTEELPGGDALIKATIVENEQFWLGTLLSLGGNVEVISPEKIRTRLLRAAEEIVAMYQK